MTNFEQLQAKIEGDATFGEKLLELESAEEAQAFLQAEGMEFTLEELNAFAEAVNLYAERGGELSDEDLDSVAGGTNNSVSPQILNVLIKPSDPKSYLKEGLKRVFRGW